MISECSSVSISAARRSSSSAAFRLRVSSGNSSALRRRQVLDRLECRGWVVVRVPSALQPSSALAVALAAEKPVGNLVLEAPFTLVADVGAWHYWFVPVRLS